MSADDTAVLAQDTRNAVFGGHVSSCITARYANTQMLQCHAGQASPSSEHNLQ
jgi:hypothetical protein